MNIIILYYILYYYSVEFIVFNTGFIVHSHNWIVLRRFLFYVASKKKWSSNILGIQSGCYSVLWCSVGGRKIRLWACLDVCMIAQFWTKVFLTAHASLCFQTHRLGITQILCPNMTQYQGRAIFIAGEKWQSIIPQYFQVELVPARTKTVVPPKVFRYCNKSSLSLHNKYFLTSFLILHCTFHNFNRKTM